MLIDQNYYNRNPKSDHHLCQVECGKDRLDFQVQLFPRNHFDKRDVSIISTLESWRWWWRWLWWVTPVCGPHPGTTNLIHTSLDPEGSSWGWWAYKKTPDRHQALSKRPLNQAWLLGGAPVLLRAGYADPSWCSPSRRPYLGGVTGSLGHLILKQQSVTSNEIHQKTQCKQIKGERKETSLNVFFMVSSWKLFLKFFFPQSS